jgi:tetratricopeptide (TPR) repeat protein
VYVLRAEIVSYLPAVFALWLQTVAPEPDLNRLVDQIWEATVIGDVNELARHGETLNDWLADEAFPDRELCLYTLAYAKWRLAFLPGHEEIAERRELLKQSERHLKMLLEAEPDNVEAYALLGAVYGGRITNTWEKLTLGHKAQSALNRAAKLAPDNPRVVLNRAVAQFYKPRLFGGGKDKALKGLRRAEALLEKEPSDKPWPNWGRVEVQTWIGFVLAQKGDREGARAAYERALVLAPGHSRVLNLLLPQLEAGGS